MKKIKFKPVKDLSELKRGDIVRGVSSTKSYVVESCYGNRVTAVATVDLTNPFEWTVLTETDE